jgi:ABC-2 type transport system ATP-binding protein
MDHGHILALDTPAALKASVGADTIVTVSADGDLGRLGTIVSTRVDGVASTREADGHLRVAIRGATGVLPAIVYAAEEAGFSVKDLSIAEPSLETVFINLTGKELRD